MCIRDRGSAGELVSAVVAEAVAVCRLRSPPLGAGDRAFQSVASLGPGETSSPALPWAPPPTVTATTISATARRRRNRPKNSPTRPTNSTSIPALKKTRRRLLRLDVYKRQHY